MIMPWFDQNPKTYLEPKNCQSCRNRNTELRSGSNSAKGPLLYVRPGLQPRQDKADRVLARVWNQTKPNRLPKTELQGGYQDPLLTPDTEGWHNFIFCDESWVVDEREREMWWRWEWWQGYNHTWVIRCTTCIIVLESPRISAVIPETLRTRTCQIGDSKLTRTWNSLQLQSLQMISLSSSHLSLSSPQLYHYLRTQSSVISLYLSMPCSTVNTEYNIDLVRSYTKYRIHWVLSIRCV